MIPITSSNLVLETITPAHAAKLFPLLQAEELYTYIPQNPPVDIAALQNKYTRWAVGQSESGDEIWLNFALYHPRLAAYVGTLQATIQINGVIYIAYETFLPFQRQGFAKESCQTMIDYLKQTYPTHDICAHVDTRNQSSIGLLHALGFKLKETLYHADEFKGSISDEFVYTL